VLARACALALARAASARGAAVKVAWFDTTLHPPVGLRTPREVAALVQTGMRGGVDVARVVGQATAQVAALAQEYARVEVQWLLHAQSGAETAGAVAALARRLRSLAGVRALFVSAGAGEERPALAGVLASRWAALGSDVLHEAEARARAARALRGLARPADREQLAVEPSVVARRRVVAASPAPPDPARALLDSEQWEAALAELAPRARQGDEAAKRLLAELIEGPLLSSPLVGAGLWVRGNAYALLDLRLRAAALLGEVGDPRLLDPQSGNSALGHYWCEIAAGPFWYGDDRRNQPLRQLTLPYTYRIARYLVTNAEYRRFVEADGYRERAWWTEQGWRVKHARTQPNYWDNELQNQPCQPVVGIAWYDAAAYCAWLTAQGHSFGWLPTDAEIRLPTSLEWERAARHTDTRRYPWGDTDPDANRANYQETRIGRPSPVGCFPAGAAVCGALDMSGNVVEWLATGGSAAQAREPRRDFIPRDTDSVVVKCGGYAGAAEELFCGARNWYHPNTWINGRGFRLVWSFAFVE
jgi:formylglycine-generating enzyme required for sulfatase activity